MFTNLINSIAYAESYRKENIEFESENYNDFREILMKKPTSTVKLNSTLSFPDEAKEKYPAIVLLHSHGGYQETCEGWYANSFRRAGFAVLTYESFGPRNITDAPTRSDLKLLSSVLSDAYHALRILSKYPKIEATKIAIAGFSFGGEVAHIAAFEPLRAAQVQGGLKFAAHLLFYPGLAWGIQAGVCNYTGSPILMLMGEKDDCSPPSKLRAYLEYLKSAGITTPIETIFYPQAYHGWGDSRYTPTKFRANLVSSSKCPFILFAPQSNKGLSMLEDGLVAPYDFKKFETCRTKSRGYYNGFNEEIRKQSFVDAGTFLRRVFE